MMPITWTLSFEYCMKSFMKLFGMQVITHFIIFTLTLILIIFPIVFQWQNDDHSCPKLYTHFFKNN
ncbi:hypothetical protein B4U80_05628 [Leptotrombidium deliense]|uniref:Uncharacterized protein n=1 Tax=Leptotrombidium deliense TaxID=299467 RepID=A0A443SIF9_9ACAR|nr:hypothetical protein B4U80_05628 [Leptotrombidium deliense]